MPRAEARGRERRRGRKRRNGPAALAPALALALALAAGGGARAQGPLAAGETLVGLVVGERDLGAVIAVLEPPAPDGAPLWLLPLEETARLLGARIDAAAGGAGARIATPVGARPLPAAALETRGGARFLRSDFLTGTLGVPLEFSERLQALVLDLPWTPGDPISEAPLDAADDAAAAAPPPPAPDFRAPPFGLARVTGDVGLGWDGGDAAPGLGAARVSLRAAGPAFGGLWQAALAQDADAEGFGEVRLEDYAWVRRLGPELAAQIGHQRLTVGPLVGGVETTAAQLAWSNREAAFQPGGSPGALLSRFGSGTRSFAGDGPPGGRVELWVADRQVASTSIDLDGRFEIRDAPLFGLQTQVELRIFRRLRDPAPIEVRAVTVTRAAGLQPAGSVGLLAGAGVEGNALFPDGDGRDEATAFARASAAPLSGLTLGAAGIGFADGHWIAGADAVAELGPFAAGSAAAAFDPSGLGAYEAGLTAAIGEAYLDLSAYEAAAGFGDRFGEDDAPEDPDDDPFDDVFTLFEPETLDRRAALGWRRPGRFDVGIEARETEVSRHVLPFAFLAPLPELTLSAFPDAFGDYRFEGVWRDPRGFELRALRLSRTTALRAERSLSPEALGDGALYADALADDSGDWRVLAGAAFQRLPGLEADWRAELGADAAGPIAYAALSRPVAPGVRGVVEAGWAQAAFTGFLGLSLDVGVSRGRLTSTVSELDFRRGAVAARLLGPDGAPLMLPEGRRPDLLLDGVPMARDGEDGVHVADRVPAGLARLEIAEADLPIELTPARRAWLVEVAPGAVTEARLPLELRLGFAGRATDAAGAPAPGARLEVLGPDGAVAAVLEANRFGQFRADGLAPGRWRLVGGGRESEVTLTDGFVFGVVHAGDWAAEADAAAADAAEAEAGAAGRPAGAVGAD